MERRAAGASPSHPEPRSQHLYVLFSRAAVESVAVAGDQAGNAVDATLTSEGAEVLESATAEAAQAGDNARLVIRVGVEVLSAVAVAEPLEGTHFLMALPPGLSADEFTERVGRG